MIKKFLNTRTILFFGLGLLVGLLIVINVLQKSQPPAPAPSPIPIPSPSPTILPAPAFGDPTYFQEMEEANENFYPLLKYLPYQTEDFAIKYTDPLVLEVKLIGPDSETAREKALQWLKSISADLGKHSLNFLTL